MSRIRSKKSISKILSYCKVFFCSLLIVTVSVPPMQADDASAAFNRGEHAMAQKQYDAAYEAYKQAFALKPREPKYLAAFLDSRTTAAIEHVKNGQKYLESQKLDEAFTEFQRGAEIDPTNFVAADQMRRVTAMLKRQAAGLAAAGPPTPDSLLAAQAALLEGPLKLEPSPNSPISMRMTTTADNVYKTIGKLGGINVLFDLDYKPQKITIELNEVTLEDALRMVALESKTFWRPISSTAIFVTSEGKRKEMESNVMKTFYLTNSSGTADLQEVVGTLKGMLDISRIQVNAAHSSITMRGTPDQLVLAEKLINDFDKPKSEVIIDISVLEVNRDLIRNLGTTVQTQTTISPLSATGVGAVAGSGLVKVGTVLGTPYTTALPSATFTTLLTDSKTKVLQSPEVRALNDEKATLRIGDRVPIATGSYSSGVGGTSVAPLVNTQFQYLDVGVNIDITPHIHSENEVTLKMALEISTVTTSEDIGGFSQPVIGQRRIEHVSRLRDGEVNLIGGILDDTETHSLNGYPWLARIPILGYLFGQQDREHQQNEVVFAVTPHIVRADEITNENLRLIDVGTGTNLTLRYREPKGTSDVVPTVDTPDSPTRKGPPVGPAPRAPAAGAGPNL
jgi:general secretion pathway protein D